MNWELLRSLLPWILLGFAFAGSLVACKGIAARFWFTVGMPIVYVLIYLLCFVIIAAIATPFFPTGESKSLGTLAALFSGIVSLGIFVLQVCSMAKDTRGGRQGYSIATTRKKTLGARATRLQRLPTRKRWSG